jgi:hypothetical protein
MSLIVLLLNPKKMSLSISLLSHHTSTFMLYNFITLFIKIFFFSLVFHAYEYYSSKYFFFLWFFMLMSTIHQNIFFSLVFHAYEYLGIPFSTITPKSLTITSTSQFSFCISINSFFFHNDILTQLNYLIPHPYIISPFLPPIYVMIFITFYMNNLYQHIYYNSCFHI